MVCRQINWLCAALLCLCAVPALGMDSRGAQLWGQTLDLATTWRGRLAVEVALSDPLPYAVRLADDPPRLVVAFDGAVTLAPGGALADGAELTFSSQGAVLHVPLDKPRLVQQAAMIPQKDGRTKLELLLVATDAATFATQVARWPERPTPERMPYSPTKERLHVMLDPGHGGFDPGAEHGGVREADLVLIMAQMVQNDLEEAGALVSLTRTDDSFVSLPDRIARANRAGADLFVSLHADAVSVGHATGASVHSLPDDLSTASNQFLLRRLGQDALGSTASPIEDETARILMELAREDAQRAGAELADRLVAVMETAGIDLYKTPRKRSNFVVLRAADMASVLVELGFLSERKDREHLVDPVWRARMANAIAVGILDWAQAN